MKRFIVFTVSFLSISLSVAGQEVPVNEFDEMEEDTNKYELLQSDPSSHSLLAVPLEFDEEYLNNNRGETLEESINEIESGYDVSNYSTLNITSPSVIQNIWPYISFALLCCSIFFSFYFTSKLPSQSEEEGQWDKNIVDQYNNSGNLKYVYVFCQLFLLGSIIEEWISFLKIMDGSSSDSEAIIVLVGIFLGGIIGIIRLLLLFGFGGYIVALIRTSKNILKIIGLCLLLLIIILLGLVSIPLIFW